MIGHIKIKPIKYLYNTILFIISTKTFVLIASLTNVTIGIVTSIIFFLSVLILILEYIKGNFILKKSVQPIFLFTLVAPILVSFLTFKLDLRMLFLQLFYFIVFLLSIQFYFKYGRKSVYKVFLYSLLFTCFFGLLSVVNPLFFSSYSLLSDSLAFYGGRAFGFYLQPNALAMGINLMYIGLILSYSNIKQMLVLYPIVFISILITGSRTGVAVFVITSSIFFWRLIKYRFTTFIKFGLIITLVAIILFSSIVPKIINSYYSDSSYTQLEERIEYILGINENPFKKISSDGSMQDRFEYQKKYIKMISQRPFFGYGFGVQHNYFDNNNLIDSAHNTFLEIFFQGGIIYFLFFLLFYLHYIKIGINARYKMYDQKIKIATWSILALFFFYFFFSTTLLTERVLYVVIGFISVCSEINILEFNEDTDNYSRI